MNDARPARSSNLAGFGKVMEDSVRHGAGRTTRAGMNCQFGRLVQDDEMRILVQDPQDAWLGDDDRVGLRRR